MFIFPECLDRETPITNFSYCMVTEVTRKSRRRKIAK
jgi:hypothetical protein